MVNCTKGVNTGGGAVYNPFNNMQGPARMTSQHSMTSEEIARAKLEVLRREHRDLDEAISALATQTLMSSLTLQRLKKQKLALKDRIARLEDELTPDIIA